MKPLSFILFILATVLLVSSALPVQKDEGGSLLEQDMKFLQKKRPPAKTPGPKFGGEEEEEPASEEGGDAKSKGKKGKKPGLRSGHNIRSYDLDDHENLRSQGRHFVSRDTDFEYLNEETQQEIGNLLHSE